MKERTGKRKWVGDALKFAACAGLLALAWWLWERNLGPEFRDAFSSKPRPAASAPDEGTARR